MKLTRKQMIEKAIELKGKMAHDFNFKTDWCASFIDYLFGDSTPFTINEHYSCTAQVNYWKKSNKWYEPKDINLLQVGDILYYVGFDDIPNDYDHVGIVTYIHGNNISVLEGNNGGGSWSTTSVNYRYITKDYKYIGGFAKPDYSIDSTVSDAKMNYGKWLVDTYLKRVEIIQMMLNSVLSINLEIDGYFGYKTEKAVIDFQSLYDLEIDGIVGINTITKLCLQYFKI